MTYLLRSHAPPAPCGGLPAAAAAAAPHDSAPAPLNNSLRSATTGREAQPSTRRTTGRTFQNKIPTVTLKEATQLNGFTLTYLIYFQCSFVIICNFKTC